MVSENKLFYLRHKVCTSLNSLQHLKNTLKSNFLFVDSQGALIVRNYTSVLRNWTLWLLWAQTSKVSNFIHLLLIQFSDLSSTDVIGFLELWNYNWKYSNNVKSNKTSRPLNTEITTSGKPLCDKSLVCSVYKTFQFAPLQTFWYPKWHQFSIWKLCKIVFRHFWVVH